jgi:hypothetical protein
MRLKLLCNCNHVVDICRSWDLPLVNIGGVDVAEGAILATTSLVGGCVWEGGRMMGVCGRRGE